MACLKTEHSLLQDDNHVQHCFAVVWVGNSSDVVMLKFRPRWGY
jgi:hypothetical protein